jgi:hypothetical protein
MDDVRDVTSVIGCTWEYDDGRVCGKPADAFRVTFWPAMERWWYCRRHLRTVRRSAPDDMAARHGVQTYRTVAA